MSQILYMEIVSFSIHNIVYFPPCLDRKDGEAARTVRQVGKKRLRTTRQL